MADRLDALNYFVEKINGVSTNVFRLESQTGTSATANRILRFTLPSNSLLNLRSFCLNFSASANGVAAAGGRLPAKIDSLIERYEVSIGGVQLSAGCNFYQVLRAAKDAWYGNQLDPVLGHPDMVRRVSYVNGAGAVSGGNEVVLTTTANEEYLTTANRCQFSVDKWEGFLGTCEPPIFDSGRCADIVIAVYLSDNTVLSSTAGVLLSGSGAGSFDTVGTGTATYALSNIHATIEAVGLNDAVYDSMIDNVLNGPAGSLDIGFKQYLSFQDTTANTLRFSLAVQSLDRLWVAHRTAAFSVQGAPIKVAGYKVVDPSSNSGMAAYDNGGGDNIVTNAERYIGIYTNFVEPTATSSAVKQLYQFTLNSSMYPQYQATFEQMAAITRNSLIGGQDAAQKKIPLNTMKTNFSVQCIRLNLPNSEFQRIQSGLDTRGISLSAYYNLYNVSPAVTVNLFAECSSTLRIGSQKQMEVIQ